MATRIDTVRRYEPVTDLTGLGEAMRAISPQQRAFVMAFIDGGACNAAAAARAAGYGSTSESPEQGALASRVAGWRLIHNERVLLAVKELAEGRLRSFAYRAANVLIEIADDPTHKDRFNAAKQLMAHGGLVVVQEHRVVHETKSETRTEILERIKKIAEKHNLNADALIQRRFEEAEAVEVKTLPAPAEPDMSADGLEDLL